jgi:hypothetical protein
MSQIVELTVPMSADMAKLQLPEALDERLHFLLDQQSRKGELSVAEAREAEALAQMASMLSILKVGAQVKTAGA